MDWWPPSADEGEAMTGWMQAALAYADLEAWIAEHDPDGEMCLLEQIDAYYADAMSS